MRKFPWTMVIPYIIAQLVGGILAGLMTWFMFGNTLRQSLVLGSTHPGPGIPWYTALVTEFVITMVLMLVVMANAVYERAPGGANQSGLAIGLWVGAAILLALPVSGASLNPARTLGPDIAAAQFPLWWIYIVGPVAGAIAGAVLWTYLLGKGRRDVAEASGHVPQQQAAGQEPTTTTSAR